MVEEESADSEDSVAGESTDSSSPPIKTGLFTKSTSEPPSYAHTRSYGNARKTKDREAFYKGWKGDGGVPTRRYKRTREEITVISRRVLCR